MKKINILGIESSCDETSAAVVVNGRIPLSCVISSQIDIHKKYGGVVPEIASRKHIENIDTVTSKALSDANLELKDIDAIAVTSGPGLVGALLVGISYAKGLSLSKNIKLIDVHHIEGHICANYLEDENFAPPYICLVVSGGHSNLIIVKDYNQYEVVGKTRDDAVGEAFDKVARVLGLPYPGGPNIDLIAKEGDPFSIDFPKVYLDNTYDFSFSGIKSSVLNYVNKAKMQNIDINKNNIAASFQQAVVEVLVNKTISLAKETSINKIAIAGGVACNSFLRECMYNKASKEGIFLKIPKPLYCTDNAAMIASSGFYLYSQNKYADYFLNANPNLKLVDFL